MRDATFFTKPEYDWQRRYEALRASFVDQLPAKVVADRFDYTPAYIRLLKHLFKHEKIELSEPVSEGKAVRRRVSADVRQKIRTWRERQLSAAEITQLLSEEGVAISVRTVERVLIEEGFSKLTRRTRIKVGLTVKGTEVPARLEPIYIDQINGQRFGSPGAGVFLFVPFLAQDADSKLLLYTAADIMRNETNDQILDFLSFWKGVQRGVKPMLIFDSKFTTYSGLSELAAMGIKFITLRRRGERLLEKVEHLTGWQRIDLHNTKRKYPHPQIKESIIQLRGYNGELRQVIVKGTGREKPSFLITNEFNATTKLVVENYARRWRIENGIAEAVKFFNLNALSSPILVKVHFDVTMTMIADTLYSMLAQKLRGFDQCDAPTLYRHFIRGKGMVAVQNSTVTVIYPRRAHNPILRAVPWQNLPKTLPGLPGAKLDFQFK